MAKYFVYREVGWLPPERLRGLLALARVGDTELAGGVVAATFTEALAIAQRQFYRRPWEFLRPIRAVSADLCEEVLRIDARWHLKHSSFEVLMERIAAGQVLRIR